VHISALEEHRAPDVVRLWEETGLTRPWNDPLADIRQALASPTSTVLVGCEDEPPGAGDAAGERRVVASAMAGFDGHRGWLYYVAVSPSRQGRGWGTAMVRAGIGWLREHGAVKAQLMVRTTNEEVVSFYESLGFEEQEVTVLGRRLAP
jgi:ribosomal protein S18 acetylase RimI-like enzyme